MWKITNVVQIKDYIYNVTVEEFNSDETTPTGESITIRHNKNDGEAALTTAIKEKVDAKVALTLHEESIKTELVSKTSLTTVADIKAK